MSLTILWLGVREDSQYKINKEIFKKVFNVVTNLTFNCFFIK